MPKHRHSRDTLAAIGEVRAIERLAHLLPTRSDVRTGIGDDCAAVRLPGPSSTPDLLLTSDAVIQGVHFDDRTPLAGIGHKAIGRVLSDIASMGGEPAWALVNLVAPRRMRVRHLEAIYRGARALARKHGLAIIGGDTAAADRLQIHVFCAGFAPRGKALRRAGAKPGDQLFVTGSLGGSIRGRHCRFEPRLAEGRFLRSWATSMIDLSDGLAKDLRHVLAASRVGARLWAEDIPISRAVTTAGGARAALRHALCDGEDFELLFTVPQARAAAFRRAWASRFRTRCTLVGVMTSRRGAIELEHRDGRREALTWRGYDHFSL